MYTLIVQPFFKKMQQCSKRFFSYSPPIFLWDDINMKYDNQSFNDTMDLEIEQIRQLDFNMSHKELF